MREADQLDQWTSPRRRGQQNGLGRETPVNPSELVRRLQAGRGLPAEIQALLLRQGTTPGERHRQELAGKSLAHRIDQPIVRLVQVVNRDNVAMVDLDSALEAWPPNSELGRRAQNQ